MVQPHKRLRGKVAGLEGRRSWWGNKAQVRLPGNFCSVRVSCRVWSPGLPLAVAHIFLLDTSSIFILKYKVMRIDLVSKPQLLI